MCVHTYIHVCVWRLRYYDRQGCWGLMISLKKYMHVYMCMYTSICVCVYTYIHVCVYICTCVCIHIYICVYMWAALAGRVVRGSSRKKREDGRETTAENLFYQVGRSEKRNEKKEKREERKLVGTREKKETLGVFVQRHQECMHVERYTHYQIG